MYLHYLPETALMQIAQELKFEYTVLKSVCQFWKQTLEKNENQIKQEKYYLKEKQNGIQVSIKEHYLFSQLHNPKSNQPAKDCIYTRQLANQRKVVKRTKKWYRFGKLIKKTEHDPLDRTVAEMRYQIGQDSKSQILLYHRDSQLCIYSSID